MLPSKTKRAFKKAKYIFKSLRINLKLKSIKTQEFYSKGSKDWLIATEIKYGGITKNVPRDKVSPSDPRSLQELSKGGMIGGDKMLHHGYAKAYSEHLKEFINREGLVIVEFGILTGTGIALLSDLFPNSTIIGLDIDLNHFLSNKQMLEERGAFANVRLELYECDQFTVESKDLEIILAGRKIDILIDDGFHSIETITNTANAAKDHVNTSHFSMFFEDNSNAYLPLKDIAKNNNLPIYSYGEMTVIAK